MFYCEVEANQYIFKQGDNASSYFILGFFIKFSKKTSIINYR